MADLYHSQAQAIGDYGPSHLPEVRIMAENKLYCTFSEHPREPDKFYAIMSMGSPQLGDVNVEVLATSDPLDSAEDCQRWCHEQALTRPWVKRS